MNKINLSRSRISRLVWEAVLENSCIAEAQHKASLLEEGAGLDRLREQAQYNTGSISTATCWALYALSTMLKPKVVAEVGTFIGRSTLSFIRGMEHAGVENGTVLTCDYSNDIELPISSNIKLLQFRKQSSTDMFAAMSSSKLRCDFLSLDGRLQGPDFPLLTAIIKEQSVILLDDFEGIEKGVVNASTLMSALQPTHNLIYPPTNELLNKFRLLDGCSTALIVPRSSLVFTNQ
jgi:predicted O-methyltransferase YrrM